MTHTEQEAERIKQEYLRRASELPADFYSLSKPANLFAWCSQRVALRDALEAACLFPLGNLRILEVGCGDGDWLRSLEDFGVAQTRLSGIDLSTQRVGIANGRQPAADIRLGDAASLPWDDGYFDLVLQSTMFTSILNDEVRQQVAREMLRVLAPDGVIVWYDFVVDNPANRNVRGIGRRELRHLFPGCTFQFRRVTLAPPLARRLVPWSWTLATMLQSLRILNTHDLIAIRRGSR